MVRLKITGMPVKYVDINYYVEKNEYSQNLLHHMSLHEKNRFSPMRKQRRRSALQ